LSRAVVVGPATRGAWRLDLPTLAPFLALGLLILMGAAVNLRFLDLQNLTNVVTRSAFMVVIGVGATFVIAAGGLDLSVGSMSAFVGGLMILAMNAAPPQDMITAIAVGAAMALGGGALCGLGNGVITTAGRIEPFIVTLGTMGVFRALITYLA
jgi:ribose transport system permease protein